MTHTHKMIAWTPSVNICSECGHIDHHAYNAALAQEAAKREAERKANAQKGWDWVLQDVFGQAYEPLQTRNLGQDPQVVPDRQA